MAEVQIRPATPAPAVQANTRDTRVVGVHPEQTHITNGAAVKIGGGPGAAVRANMGPAGARVATPTGTPTGTPRAQTGAVVQKAPAAPAPRAAANAGPKAQETAAAPALTLAEAALALEIVEGQVTQVVLTQAAPAPLLELAKDVVKKLRAIAGVPASVPLPWDLVPSPTIEAAPPQATIAPPVAPSADPAAPPASATVADAPAK